MKKLFLGIITVMLLLAIMLPLSVNAATFITKTASEISAGDIVELEIKTNSKVESMQFDVNFNPEQYEYVIDSAESELNETDSNYISANQVRVSAYGLAEANGQQQIADTVTMKFKAKATATGNSSFKIGAVEVNENGITENVADGEVEVKINGKVIDNNNDLNNDLEEIFIDDEGNEIRTIGQWGYIPPLRIYDDLVANKHIVAYALPYSDDVIKVDNLKAEFGNEIFVTGADSDGVVGTGDTFILNSTEYTILIYGDTNGDGKVTTADALTTTKYEGKGTLNIEKEEALNIVKTGKSKTNAKAQQEFILRKPTGTVKKESEGTDYPLILDAYPEEVGQVQDRDLIDAINVNDDILETLPTKYRYKQFQIATISSKNNVEITNKEGLTAEIKLGDKVVDSKTATVTYTPDSSLSGAYSMTFSANVAGDYTITPILIGANVEGGVLNKNEEIKFTVEEDPTITSIRVTDLESDGKALVKTGREKTIGLTFIHEYPNTNGEEGVIQVDKDHIEIIDIDETYLSKSETDFVVENGYVTGISVKANDIPTTGTSLKIRVKHKYNIAEIKDETINIKIEKAKTAGITFNGKELSHTVTQANTVTLYNDNIRATDDMNDLVTISYDSDENNTQKKLMAILPIQLRDEDGMLSPIRKGDIEETSSTEEGKIAIYDTEFEGSLSDIEYFTKTNNTYERIDKNQEGIDDIKIYAIGISLLTFDLRDEADEGRTIFECLKSGFDISYDTLAGRQTAHIPVRIFENGVEITQISKDDDIEDSTQQPPATFNLRESNEIPTAEEVVEPKTSIEAEELKDTIKSEGTETQEASEEKTEGEGTIATDKNEESVNKEILQNKPIVESED